MICLTCWAPRGICQVIVPAIITLFATTYKHRKALANSCVNTLRPRQNGRRFPNDIFKRIFMNENIWISIKIPLNFVPKGPINNIPALFQIMAWRRPGDKPLSESMMARLLTHICVTRPQWVKWLPLPIPFEQRFIHTHFHEWKHMNFD